MIENLGGRKFIYALFVTILAFVLVLTGKVDSDAFLKFAAGIGTIYTAGNTVSKFSQGR